MAGRWAAEYFEGVRRAVRDLADARAMLESGGEQWRPDGGRGSGPSDPTAAAAIRLAELQAKREEWAEAATQCETAIGEGLAVIEGVRAFFSMLYGDKGSEYADVLDMVYVDAIPIKQAARIMCCSVNTAKSRRAHAIRWLDDAGKARALDLAERAVLCADRGDAR
ncbi:MAG: hypothetical protein SOW20_07820 [Berryella intestinalis]|uniref:hypothetical protein n=1 Tax=Berryella intestinalis TaxID=1531429 RepID=UPI002A75CEF0|nr:hypothetical protein [Berryella intestinalis]MDY3129911.1 hypothetical protein [Berryella intestinalis]